MSTLEKHDAELEEQEFLKGVPALLPPEQFRQKQRSQIMKLVNRLRQFVNDDGEVDTSNDDAIDRLLDILGDADEFFESIAADTSAYLDWSRGLKNSEQIFGALISTYARAVGE